ncbi:MAG: nickel pincer cofactor biosynthesis protein LarB [Planctomycetota bacterium]|nr:nickel pincer cofactor biosynthesis protein LarB [Planctomycetota bacterium]
MDREIPLTDNPLEGVYARLDADRASRCGAPEAVFAAGKTLPDLIAIVKAFLDDQGFALVTRASPEAILELRRLWPQARFSRRGGTALVGKPPEKDLSLGFIAVVAAGTSDLGAAEEAVLSLDSLGIESRLLADVGISGLHRLLNRLEEIRPARVVIALAGMEGALPSVLAGLVTAPVIAVPTSVGYGVSFAGVSALLGMLSSCAPGLATVNIDNGFGAAVTAARIIRLRPWAETEPNLPASRLSPEDTHD